MVLPAVPEIVELDMHESVETRTEALMTIRQLGPPDLVHLTKGQPKSGVKEVIGTYHHVTGVDASSSASLAAYINTLIYTIGENQIWFGKPVSWKIHAGIYCCYNAFSRVDMRVDVKIPGSVEAYAVDERGEKRVATEALWLETYLCGILRAFAYADDYQNRIIGCRRLNPITSTDAEHRFFEAAEKLFFKGWQLGSDPEIQVPNVVSNHLTSGILKYIHTTGRFASGINLFEKLRSKEPEVASLLAKVLIDADEEVKAVSLLYETIKLLPMDYALLDVQAAFCQSKGRNDLALECAKRAVNSAPSEFTTWCKLAEIYIAVEQYELALLTLNSCPMFTYQDRDLTKMPQPQKMHLPVLQESVIDDPMDDYDVKVDPLPAASLKGTFAKAYSLLTEITSRVGWDMLLKYRSNVFVMEEEYRHEKNASTTTIRGSVNENGDGSDEEGRDSVEQDEPEKEETMEALTISKIDETNGDAADAEAAEVDAEKKILKDGDEPAVPVETPQLSKPEQVIDAVEAKAGGGDETSTTPDPSSQTKDYTQFHNKRLCERWLDNLFMVLYEDLRVYTIWRSELQRQKMNNMQVKKSAAEWEVHGELAERLHHPKEAVEAYVHCLNITFSARALRGLLTNQEKAKDNRGALDSIIRLTAWNYRWYSEFSPALLYSVRKLIAEEGAIKFRSIVQSTQSSSLPQAALDLTHHYASICAAFRSSGSDA